ncbi:helix-turn-helix domain-containing protein [Hymenobacter rubripertinctus]|uniref:XRE family transcriptional regulator n=1 Tax=Hymenobacter rubripertinctus TaxID=2029981 RepID=A0A418QJ31_9BACT|nr:helix-turn-helix transcriptional regulator [Hymenobacter rubripertinctus]RIY05203.1 XRE family transcriptional regulator [Hymenobacter rubripertinctus]
MPQKATPSTTLAAAVRAHLGFSQEQLATVLGISRGQIAHVEAGRRQLGPKEASGLRQLAQRLPPPLGSAPQPLCPKAVSPAPAVLRRRRAWCVREAANGRVALSQLEADAALAHRWEGLLRELDRDPTTVLDPTLVKRLRTERLAAPPAARPATAAAHTLLTLRIGLLEAEASALAALLADAPGPE